MALLPHGSPFGDPGPHGDLFQILGPHWVPIFFKVPIFSNSGLRTRENSVQPPSNVDHLIIQCKWHKHCALNEDTLCLCEYFLFKKKLASSMNLLVSVNFEIYAFWVPISAVEGPHLVPISLKIGSPLGPH